MKHPTLDLAVVAFLVLLLPCAMAAGQGSPARADANPAGNRAADETPPSIGVAWMDEDGTIILRLVARGAGGATAEALLRYPRSHPQYLEILRHIGPLKPGESRPVPPWPED